MIRRPPRSTLFPYTTLLPIFTRTELPAADDTAYPVVGAPPDVDDTNDADSHVFVAHRDHYNVHELAHHAMCPRRYEIGRAHVLNSSHANISYAVFCLKKKNPL